MMALDLVLALTSNLIRTKEARSRLVPAQEEVLEEILLQDQELTN